MTAPAASRPAFSRLRPVEPEDSALLYAWLNRPDSRAASLETSAPVSWDDHCRWLAARLKDPATRLWIVDCAGAAAGQVRMQDKGQGPEVAIYLDARWRGSGVAAAALRAAVADAGTVWPDQAPIARIRPDNAASRHLFEACGFVLSERRPDHLVYRYEG